MPCSFPVSGSVRSFRYNASQKSMDRRKFGGVDATDTLPINCSALLSYLFSGLGDQPLPRHDLSWMTCQGDKSVDTLLVSPTDGCTEIM